MDKRVYNGGRNIIFFSIYLLHLNKHTVRKVGNLMQLRKPIPIEEAVELVMKNRLSGEKEKVSIIESDNRRLAEPIIATNDIPSFNKSPYDGFALRSEDTMNADENNTITLEIIEHIGAGVLPTKELKQGEATRIMTGAQIPNGADCVVMLEDTDTFSKDGKSFIILSKSMESNQNIIEKGSEVKEGTVLVEEGTMINPGVKALMATFGYKEIFVAKKPLVGILATGTELLEVDEPIEPGKIRNSNAYMVASQILRAGGVYKYFGKLADEFDSSYETVKQALDEVDILITTGGVSVGDFDLMPAIYEKLEANVLFNKVAMRPGSVTTVATLNDKILFGLSGNPSACYVGFELFARPILQNYQFNKNPYLKRTKAKMVMDFPKANPFTRFVRSYITYADHGTLNVHLAGMDKSNVVSSLARSTSLMVLPGGTKGYQQGDFVDVLLLDDMEGQADF